MTNIPFIITIISSVLTVGTLSFRVIARDDNPDLTINEELNLVEPKLDFWHVFLRPRGKSSFNNVLKLINNFDTRNKYSVIDNDPALAVSNPSLFQDTDLKADESVTTEKIENKKTDDSIIVQDENPEIVSEEVIKKENTSEEKPKGIIPVASVSSSESNEKSESSDSSQNVKVVETNDSNSKESSSEISSESKQTSNVKSEKLLQLDALRYDADLPRSLHHFEMDKPRFQHSIRYGWIY